MAYTYNTKGFRFRRVNNKALEELIRQKTVSLVGLESPSVCQIAVNGRKDQITHKAVHVNRKLRRAGYTTKVLHREQVGTSGMFRVVLQVVAPNPPVDPGDFPNPNGEDTK